MTLLTFSVFSCALDLFFTVAAGQVINRLQFTWRGTPARTTAASSRAFSILIYITIFHWIMFAMLEIAVGKLDHNDSQPPPSGGYTPPSATLLAIVRVYDFFKVLYWVLATWLLTNLRVSVREKYAIPGDPCNDCCYSFWCPCLVAGQMLRHTTDYDVYPSQLCSETGLAKSSAPVIV